MVFHNLYVIVILAALFQSGQSAYESNVISQPSLSTSGGPHVSPYTVAIIRDNDWHKRCAGTLISDSFVLTAAQCVECETAELILGAFDILVNEKTQIHQTITEEDVIFYPLYDPRNRDNDIALVRLPKKVKLTPFVNVVQLPDSDFRLEFGIIAYITGWEHRLNGYSNTLSQAELMLISNDKCISFWPVARINYSKMCASNARSKGQLHHLLGSDCIVDPGSPLTLHDNPDKLIGILTGESRCGSPLPEVFVNVAPYRNWIDEQLQLKEQPLEEPGISTTEIEITVEKTSGVSVQDVEKETNLVIEEKLDSIDVEVESEHDLRDIVPHTLDHKLIEHPFVEPSYSYIPLDYWPFGGLEEISPLYNFGEVPPELLGTTLSDYPFLEDWGEELPLYNLGRDVIIPPSEALLLNYLSTSGREGVLPYALGREVLPQAALPGFEKLEEISTPLNLGDVVKHFKVRPLYNLAKEIRSLPRKTRLFNYPSLGDWQRVISSYRLKEEEAAILEYAPFGKVDPLFNLDLISPHLEAILPNDPLFGDLKDVLPPYYFVGEINPQSVFDYPYSGELERIPPLLSLEDGISPSLEAILFNDPPLGGSFVGGAYPQSVGGVLFDYPPFGDVIPPRIFNYPSLGDWERVIYSYRLKQKTIPQVVEAAALEYSPFGKVEPLFNLDVISPPLEAILLNDPLFGDLKDIPPYNFVGGINPQSVFDYFYSGKLEGIPPLLSLGDVILPYLEAILFNDPPWGGRFVGGVYPQSAGVLFDYPPFGDVIPPPLEAIVPYDLVLAVPPYRFVEGISSQFVGGALFDYPLLEWQNGLAGEIISQPVESPLLFDDYLPFGEWEKTPLYTLVEDVIPSFEGWEKIRPPYTENLNEGIIVPDDIPLDVFPHESAKEHLLKGKVLIEVDLVDLDLDPDWSNDGKLTVDELPFPLSDHAIITTETEDEYYEYA